MKNIMQRLLLHRAVTGFCMESRLWLRPFPEFELAFRCYRAVLCTIDALCLQEQQLTRGRNIHVAEERKIICAQAAAIASLIEVYADHAQDAALKEKVHHKYSALIRCEDKRLVRYCREIHAAGIRYSAVMEQYGLVRQVFDVLAGTIEMFNAVVPPPRNADALKKEYHQRFEFFVQQLNTILRTKMDVGARSFQAVDPDLYNGYAQRSRPGRKNAVEQAA